ncbi:MAG TPA: hypothetical protein VKM72_14745 [Thermoanaerobaculia bacterium]|nr:hypothetical protein [Thermoanaerobaculia bacterium]
MAQTVDGVMNQVFVAFGQGTGPMRVAQGACRDLRERYTPRIDEAVLARWEDEAVQVLERIRAIGRTAAAEAALAGRTAISAQELRTATLRVEAESGTPICPPAGTGFAPDASGAYTRQGILDQILVAFGQGTGALRVAGQAAAALRDRYEPYVDGRILEIWREVGVQVLERLRAMGRLAALRAVEGASTVITRPMVATAIESVEKTSLTDLCPPPPPPDAESVGVLEALGVRVR